MREFIENLLDLIHVTWFGVTRAGARVRTPFLVYLGIVLALLAIATLAALVILIGAVTNSDWLILFVTIFLIVMAPIILFALAPLIWIIRFINRLFS